MNALEPISTSPAPVSQRTACGRIPNTPLRNPKHEAVCHACVAGKTGREAGLVAGYKDTPQLKGNIYRLRGLPHMRERIAELAARAMEFNEIYDAWILARVKMLAEGSLETFFRRDDRGSLVLNEKGEPFIDFRQTSKEQLQTLKKFKYGRFGPEIEVHGPDTYLDKLMRHRGLLKDRVEGGTNIAAAQVYLIADRPMTEEEWERQRAGVG
jgi:hypothetical protein